MAIKTGAAQTLPGLSQFKRKRRRRNEKKMKKAFAQANKQPHCVKRDPCLALLMYLMGGFMKIKSFFLMLMMNWICILILKQRKSPKIKHKSPGSTVCF